jgi:outer membrane protein assembly factor BamD (BamD/ComL family)
VFFKPIQGGGHEYNASFDREAWEFVTKHRQVPPEEYIEKGRAAMKSKKWKEAYQHFTSVRSEKDIQDLLAIGEKELAAADTPAKKKKVAQAWKGTPIGDKAKE